jgi:hypothetical protein
MIETALYIRLQRVFAVCKWIQHVAQKMKKISKSLPKNENSIDEGDAVRL